MVDNSKLLEVKLEDKISQELKAALKRGGEITRRRLTAATLQSTFLLQREISEITPRGIGSGGGLAGSISARNPQVFGDTIIGEVGTSLRYAVPVELGTKPHFPPVQPLADWAVAKLGVREDEADAVGLAIARKIAAHGTKGAHMFKEGIKANREQVNQFFEQALRNIRDDMAHARGRS